MVLYCRVGEGLHGGVAAIVAYEVVLDRLFDNLIDLGRRLLLSLALLTVRTVFAAQGPPRLADRPVDRTQSLLLLLRLLKAI